ncbi:cellulose synthase-like protein E6 isoform X5 [Iris pallida]|uniref:Cellulose synthase-like protein E6 isoform X5 n=1 Tax=Iris pallida TaxID=29817 RepID=A0AAX6G3Q3_IRIPA|nr:cellulose synthase-like protein E6 isoform X5 [Iris pallida]
MLVINTVLSVMAYDYPPEKLSVYVSDDGRSNLTFYALVEAASFSKHWIPYCKKFKVEPRSPAAYLSSGPESVGTFDSAALLAIKKLYKEMENRVEGTTKLGTISGDLATQEGFSQWDSQATSGNNQAIVKILIDGRDSNAVDIEGTVLPTLVYVAREKRPQYPNNFKAGAMNALIRVSSEISNAPFILNVDCDMYSNSSDSVRDALCFFMDEESGHEISYVQYPQNFRNLLRSNIYGDYIKIINEVEFPGFGEAMFVGTGCFHRRESLCGRKYSKSYKEHYQYRSERNPQESAVVLEERAKSLVSCTYENNTGWGKDMGMMYGCPVEDAITGLSIQCKGWKSIYFNPPMEAFLGISPTALGQFLVQHKRWSEGLFKIFLSKYCPFLYGHGKIKLKVQMAYALYLLWAPLSLPMLYYVVVPSLCLLKGIPLFPKISSSWILPFAYVVAATQSYSLGECLWCGETLGSWWNMQRMRVMRRTTSYLFGLVDTVLQQLGFGSSGFVITAKVTDDESLQRYAAGSMEFGSSSPMFTILATVALLNLVCFVGGVAGVVAVVGGGAGGGMVSQMALQVLLCGLLVFGSIPSYQGLFFRKDKGALPTALAVQAAFLAALACLVPLR